MVYTHFFHSEMIPILHTLNDGSLLRKMTARELMTYSPWQGNRILDHAHVDSLEKSLNGHVELLDSGYKLVIMREIDASDAIIENKYIIDGQHRVEVLKREFKNNPFLDDFEVCVTEKRVSGEAEAIAYFRSLNHAKPIEWKMDPKLIVNKYVEALEKACMQTKRVSFIRSDTKFPYLSSSVLRTALEKEHARQQLSDDDADVAKFVENVLEWNKSKLLEPVPPTLPKKMRERLEKGIGIGFVLAVDTSCNWIRINRG
jgi:predicted nucleic acid-binding protein